MSNQDSNQGDVPRRQGHEQNSDEESTHPNDPRQGSRITNGDPRLRSLNPMAPTFHPANLFAPNGRTSTGHSSARLTPGFGEGDLQSGSDNGSNFFPDQPSSRTTTGGYNSTGQPSTGFTSGNQQYGFGATYVNQPGPSNQPAGPGNHFGPSSPSRGQASRWSPYPHGHPMPAQVYRPAMAPTSHPMGPPPRPQGGQHGPGGPSGRGSGGGSQGGYDARTGFERQGNTIVPPLSARPNERPYEHKMVAILLIIIVGYGGRDGPPFGEICMILRSTVPNAMQAPTGNSRSSHGGVRRGFDFSPPHVAHALEAVQRYFKRKDTEQHRFWQAFKRQMQRQPDRTGAVLAMLSDIGFWRMNVDGFFAGAGWRQPDGKTNLNLLMRICRFFFHEAHKWERFRHRDNVPNKRIKAEPESENDALVNNPTLVEAPESPEFREFKPPAPYRDYALAQQGADFGTVGQAPQTVPMATPAPTTRSTQVESFGYGST